MWHASKGTHLELLKSGRVKLLQGVRLNSYPATGYPRPTYTFSPGSHVQEAI